MQGVIGEPLQQGVGVREQLVLRLRILAWSTPSPVPQPAWRLSKVRHLSRICS